MVTQIGRQHSHLFDNEDNLIQHGFSPKLEKVERLAWTRVLWEDDRIGRVTQMVDTVSGRDELTVEVPTSRSAAGQTYWRPISEASGASAETVQSLLLIIRELAGDVYSYTAPLRHVIDIDLPDEDETPFRGLV